jgi:hypothetical protein
MSNKSNWALKYIMDADTNVASDHIDDLGWSKEEVDKIMADPKVDGIGFADACVFVSIIREGIGAHNGATSHAFFSFDGHNRLQPIPNTEMFSVMCSLANYLLDMDLPIWQHELIGKLIEGVRHKIVVEGHGMGG